MNLCDPFVRSVRPVSQRQLYHISVLLHICSPGLESQLVWIGKNIHPIRVYSCWIAISVTSQPTAFAWSFYSHPEDPELWPIPLSSTHWLGIPTGSPHRPIRGSHPQVLPMLHHTNPHPHLHTFQSTSNLQLMSHRTEHYLHQINISQSMRG